MSRRSRRNAVSHRTLIEPLEGRLLLAGDVSVTLKGATGYITGDSQANAIEVSRDGGNLLVSPVGDTTINGAAGPLSVSAPTNLVVRMGRGNDHLAFPGAFALDGHLQIDTGDGDNMVELTGVAIDGNLAIGFGDGVDQADLASVTVGGSFKATDQGGASLILNVDVFSVQSVTSVVSRSTVFTFLSRSGRYASNVSLIQKGEITSATFNNDAGEGAWINGGLTFKGGSGNDTLTLAEGRVGKNISCNFAAGDGVSTLQLDATACHGNVALKSAETRSDLRLSDLTVAGSLSHSNSIGQATLDSINHVVVGKSLKLKANRNDASLAATTLDVAAKASIASGAKVSVQWGSPLLDSVLGSSLSMVGRTGAGSVALQYMGVAGSLSMSLGSGGTITSLTGITVGGSLKWAATDGADALTLLSVEVAGAGSVSTGSGNDLITIDNSRFNGRASFILGDGDDIAGFQATGMNNTFLNGGFTLKADDGDDSVFLGGADEAGRRVHVGAASTVDAGRGNNAASASLDATSATVTWKNVL